MVGNSLRNSHGGSHMRKLKEYTYNECGAHTIGTTYYKKSEADKVIAEKDAEIHNLRRSLIAARHKVAKARGKEFSNAKEEKYK